MLFRNVIYMYIYVYAISSIPIYLFADMVPIK